MDSFKIISFTHKTTDISEIGKLHIDPKFREDRLAQLLAIGVDELQYLSTCNRVEFLLIDDVKYDKGRLAVFFRAFNNQWTAEEVHWAVKSCEVFEGAEAVQHMFRVASSLESLVVGEREIITQVRKSYDESRSLGLTGDYLRLLMSKTIECAKEVYTKTNIAKNPVSIVSLAYRTLKELNLKNDSRVLIVGAGETNTTMSKFLHKHGFKNFTVVNRTESKAKALADQLNGNALSLAALKEFQRGFDLLVTCTGSEEPIFTEEVYESVLNEERGKKTIVDLAIPTDVDAKVVQKYQPHYIEIEQLKEMSILNLKARKKEVENCESIISERLIDFVSAFQERQIELAMREVPKKVKEIKDMAVSQVFSKELEGLDNESREVVEKVLSYIEKKYISVPMKMAKEILLKNS